MNICILGDGKLGYAVAGKLSDEGHSIVLVDQSAEALRLSENNQDVACIIGDALNVTVLQQAGVSDADLVIATMGDDENNLVACLLSRKLGAKSCLSRVRNPEYDEALPLIREDLGLNFVVNPERSTASDISRTLRFPNATHVDFFSRGRVEVVEFSITDQSPFAEKKIMELPSLTGVHVLVCAVQRGEQVFIPNGSFVIEKGDVLSVTGTPADIFRFFKKVSKDTSRVKNVMIVGGCKICYYLTEQLLDAGVDVKIIEKDRARCQELAERLPRALVICGDGSNHETLIEEGIDSCDALVALTNLDEENVVLSMFANTRNIKKVITKINHITLGSVMHQSGIESVVTPHTIAAAQIVRYVRAMQNKLEGSSSMIAMSRLVNDHVDAMEFKVRVGFKGLNVPLKELKLRKDLLVACIIRKGKIIYPAGDDCIMEKDSCIIISTQGGIAEINDILD